MSIEAKEAASDDVVNTALAVFGGVHYGYSVAVLGATMEQVRFEYSANPLWVSCVSSATLVGSIIGSPLSGRFASDWGLVPATIVGELSSLIGALLCLWPVNLVFLATYRFSVGLGVGFCTLAKPLYVAETSENAAVILGSFPVWIGLGVSLAHAAASRLTWRLALALGAVPPVVLLALALTVMREPRRTVSTRRRTSSQRPVSAHLLAGVALAAGNQLTGQYPITVYTNQVLGAVGVTDLSIAMWISYSNVFSAVAAVLLTRICQVTDLVLGCNAIGALAYVLVLQRCPITGLLLKIITHQVGPGAGYFVLAPALASGDPLVFSFANTARYAFEFSQSFLFVPAIHYSPAGITPILVFFLAISLLCCLHTVLFFFARAGAGPHDRPDEPLL